MKKQASPEVTARRKRQAMMLALGDRQAIEMRPQAALEQRRPVDHEMMRRDRAGDARRMGAHDIDRLRRRDVLDHDLQALMVACSSGSRLCSMNTASRSKMSTAGSVASP